MKTKAFLLTLGFIAALSNADVCSQEATNGFTASRPHTHSLIVGISDYAHIDDLKFADRDAMVFRTYILNTIQNPADSNNITLLLNDKAVSPAIYQALENLVSMVEEGDKVYIYFSGHGDSENTTIFRSGFLLTYDTPAGSYYTNSINIEILNNFINTLSVKNKADVVFIADACRSGNISQPASMGMMQTARSLMQNVADEIRLLSCQPEEISLEGSQWGNGRGLFSYHLVNGLYGLADVASESDGKVILNELNVYLGTHVPRDALPVKQYPGVYGPMGKEISRVNHKVMHALMENPKENSPDVLSRSWCKGYEEKFLVALDEDQKKNYVAFHKALEQGNIQLPAVNNAFHYYEELIGSRIDGLLQTLLKRDLIAALQEEPQRFIHQLSDVDKRWHSRDIKYGKWSKDILLSAEMLGEGHYLYTTLVAKHHFLSAADKYYKAKAADQPGRKKALATEALAEVDAAIITDPLAVYYYNLKGVTATLLNKSDMAIHAFDEAIRISPDYPYPYANKGYTLMKQGIFEEALANFDACIALDPKYTNAWQYKITTLKKLNREDEALAVYREMMRIGMPVGM